MGRREKRLEKMRQNPSGWHIEDVQALCRSFGIECGPPPGGGSHWTVAHASQSEQPGVVAKKPIKPFYIRRLVSFVDKVQIRQANEGSRLPGSDRIVV
jgi:hypothetical protein